MNVKEDKCAALVFSIEVNRILNDISRGRYKLKMRMGKYFLVSFLKSDH